MEAIRITPAQAEQLATLTRAFGSGKLDGFQRLDRPGPLLFQPNTEENGMLILCNGDVVGASDFAEVAA